MDKHAIPGSDSTSQTFPPVVAVLGHVDHGKTTLLEALRKTSLVAREKGGITQTIGASSVEFMHEGQKRNVTFIDTPGHEAFTQMRGRGAKAADVALLIVSAVDGVKPQTRESIEVLKDATSVANVLLQLATAARMVLETPKFFKGIFTEVLMMLITRPYCAFFIPSSKL